MKSSLVARFNALVDKVVDRKEEFNKFINYLEKETTFFIAPASPRYHLNIDEGLLEHSINVAENLIKIKNVLYPIISDESCVIVGLFHDLGKAGEPGNPYYLINEPTPRQKQYGYPASTPFKYNSELPFLQVPLRSIVYLMRHMNITNDEIQAIMYHDGQYVPDNKGVATKELPLTLLVQYADTWSGFIIEPRGIGIK